MQNQSKKPNSLSVYASNNQELEIIEAVENSIQLGRTENPSHTALAITSRWRMNIGIPKQDTTEELMIVSSYLVDEYPFLTESEFYLAIKLSMQNKLRDCEFYGFFSPMYVSKVIESYLYYRKVQTADVVRLKEKHESEERDRKNRPTPERQCQQMKEIVKGLYDEWKSTGEIKDHFNYVYRFLRKRFWLYLLREEETIISQNIPKDICVILTKEDINEAQAFGKLKAKEFLAKQNRKTDINLKLEEDKYGRNYCVEKYFKNVDIDMLLNNIKSDYFS